MFQAGYLTIKEVKQKRNRISYCLDFPNFEVKQSFYDDVLGFLQVSPITILQRMILLITKVFMPVFYMLILLPLV